jgi:hypothetical protein
MLRKAFLLTTLIVCVASAGITVGQQNNPTGPVIPGGGGSNSNLSVTVTSNISGTVPIGTVGTFSYTFQGAVGGHSVSYIIYCGTGPTPAHIVPLQTPIVHCFQKEGSFLVEFKVTDGAGNVATDSMTIVVAGPDSIDPDITDVSNASTGPGTPMTMTHKFYPKVGTDAVGDCWQNACVYEWIAKAIDTDEDGQLDGFQPSPPADVGAWKNQGGLESCSSAPSSAYFWNNPYIFDNKVYTDDGGIADGTYVAGDVLGVSKQWVAIKVPVCGDPNKTFRYEIHGPMLMYLKVVAGKKVMWELQP